MIEILIVISIIVVVVGIALVGVAKVRDQAQAQQTKTLIQAVTGVLTEYQTATKDRSPKFMGNYTADKDSIRFFLEETHTVEPAKELLQGLNRDWAIDEIDGDGLVDVIYDAIDPPMPLRYSKYNDEGTTNRADDWYGDPGEGMPRQKQPYFASAGLDRNWGTVDATTNVPDAAASDNIYSFEQE